MPIFGTKGDENIFFLLTKGEHATFNSKDPPNICNKSNL